MKIIVLGGNGQLGARILQKLIQSFPEATVIGTVRKNHATDNLLFQENLISFDPFQDDWVKLNKADILINAIGIIREAPDMSFEMIHQDLVALILKNRALIGNPKIIHLSALGANVNSSSRFLKTKGLADEVLLGHKRNVILRPSIVCTPDTMLVQKLRLVRNLCRYSLGILPFPSKALKTKIQPVMVDDLTELITIICKEDNHPSIIEVVGPQEFTFSEMLKMLPNCQKSFPIPQAIFNTFASFFIAVFPNLFEKEQLQLMTIDNVGNKAEVEELLKRSMQTTLYFWHQQLQ